ncbi:hypothetical protein QP162_02130 [Sphingomonas aurantiaca]|uniref:hypothetical protein n=1 Tax=Sphingomonas aurantiaca TaxID=185949 RepID=UPI002FDFFADB
MLVASAVSPAYRINATAESARTAIGRDSAIVQSPLRCTATTSSAATPVMITPRTTIDTPIQRISK